MDKVLFSESIVFAAIVGATAFLWWQAVRELRDMEEA